MGSTSKSRGRKYMYTKGMPAHLRRQLDELSKIGRKRGKLAVKDLPANLRKLYEKPAWRKKADKEQKAMFKLRDDIRRAQGGVKQSGQGSGPSKSELAKWKRKTPAEKRQFRENALNRIKKSRPNDWKTLIRMNMNKRNPPM